MMIRKGGEMYMSESTGGKETTLHSKPEENAQRCEDAAPQDVKDEIKDEFKDETLDEIKEKKQAKKSEQSRKIAKLEKALAKTEEERDSFKDSYQRTFSEFNNFKKRTQTAASMAVKIGVCDAIEKILPVIDNFERALGHVEDQEDDAFATGVSMVYKQLMDIFEAMDIKEIFALGEVFDPNLHQAIHQAPAEEGIETNTVVTVVQKGYMLGDKILRHSMVIVSK